MSVSGVPASVLARGFRAVPFDKRDQRRKFGVQRCHAAEHCVRILMMRAEMIG